MTDPARIGVQETRARMRSPHPPLLVCGYEDDQKFRKFRLEGAIAFSEFQAGLSSRSKEDEIIFY